jgi:hypothetical protein
MNAVSGKRTASSIYIWNLYNDTYLLRLLYQIRKRYESNLKIELGKTKNIDTDKMCMN